MDKRAPEVLSSAVRLKVMDLLSVRPRSLGELARATGISVQGVLKHLKLLERLGLVEETTIKPGSLAVRRLYRTKSTLVGDYSTGDLTLVKFSKNTEKGNRKTESRDLESLAAESMVLKRRVRDGARRLSRQIDGLVEVEGEISASLASAGLTDEDQVILQTFFTEESLDRAEEVLVEHYGLKGGTRSIERALSRAKRLAK